MRPPVRPNRLPIPVNLELAGIDKARVGDLCGLPGAENVQELTGVRYKTAFSATMAFLTFRIYCARKDI